MAGRTRKLAVVAAAIGLLAGCGGSASSKASSANGGGNTSFGGAPTAAVSEITGVSVASIKLADSPETRAPTSIAGPATLGGTKPTVLYEGAEYCPYCATERWSMVMALAKFGTFSHLGETESSSTDVNEDTPTFSFVGSTYTSQWLNLQAVEEQDRSGQTLQHPTAAESAYAKKYDNPPYVSSSAANSIPFLLLGNRYVLSGAQWDGAPLSKQSFTTVARALSAEHPQATTPLGTAAAAAQAAAADLIKDLCTLTGDKPPVCANFSATGP